MFSLPIGSEPLFKVLALRVGQGKVINTVQSENKASFMHGEIRHWQVEGEAEVVLDAEELLKYLGVFDAKDVVSMEFGDTVTLKGSRKRAVLYPEALEAKIPPSLPQIKDKRVHYRVGLDMVPATTIAIIPTDAFKEFISDSKVVFGAQKPIFPISFEDGAVVASLGSTEAKHNIIETRVETKVDGEPVKTRLSHDFINIFQNLDTHCEIHLSAGKPVVVVVQAETYRLLYVTAPLREV